MQSPSRPVMLVMRLSALEQLHIYTDMLVIDIQLIDRQMFPSILPRELCVEGIQLVAASQ